MNDNTGFEAYCLYMCIRLHFTSKYDYFKYTGKTNTTKTSFTNRKDKYIFYKLSRKYTLNELRELYVANFVEKERWINEINGPEGEECYKNWKKINQSLTHRFEQDIIYLLDNFDRNDLFRIDRGTLPQLLLEVMQGNVTIETMIILNNMTHFFDMWKQNITDDIIWPMWLNKCLKYEPFIVYDKKKLENIVREKLKEHAET